MNLEEKIDYMNALQEKIYHNTELKEIEIQQINKIAEEFLAITKDTYNKMVMTYSQNCEEIKEIEYEVWDNLFQNIKKYINEDFSKVSLLDVGTGSGRDIKILTKKGIQVIGIDNAKNFIEQLQELANRGEIPADSFLQADMLELPFAKESFDVIRYYASLLHIPVTTKGNMFDKVLEEGKRVLKTGGIIQIAVKEGKGVQYIDTKEGMGGRIYQLFTKQQISSKIEEHGFKILKILEVKEQRKEQMIHWINLYAIKE